MGLDCGAMTASETSTFPVIAFIGGGNMAGAVIGGLRNSGHPAAAIRVVEPWAEQRELEGIAGAIVSDHGLTPAVAERLVRRHGRHAAEVAALGAQEGLLTPLAPGIDHLEAEVAWAARHEHALSVDDVLSRRMRLAQELPDRGAGVAGRVADILSAELGWDGERRVRSIGAYLETARREYGVPA